MSDFDAMPMGGGGKFTPMPKPEDTKKQPKTAAAEDTLPAPLLARSQDLRSVLEADMRDRMPPLPKPRNRRDRF